MAPLTMLRHCYDEFITFLVYSQVCPTAKFKLSIIFVLDPSSNIAYVIQSIVKLIFLSHIGIYLVLPGVILSLEVSHELGVIYTSSLYDWSDQKLWREIVTLSHILEKIEWSDLVTFLLNFNVSLNSRMEPASLPASTTTTVAVFASQLLIHCFRCFLLLQYILFAL